MVTLHYFYFEPDPASDPLWICEYSVWPKVTINNKYIFLCLSIHESVNPEPVPQQLRYGNHRNFTMSLALVQARPKKTSHFLAYYFFFIFAL